MEMAQRTEKAIAEAFKKLLSRRPLSKITISDIAAECGINRMTFYYHYHDVYDLIESICEDSFRRALEGKRTLADWQEGILLLMKSFRDEKAFMTGVYNSVSREIIAGYVHRLISELLQEGVDQVPDAAKITPKERKMIVDFYAHAFCGLLLQWIGEGMKEDPAVLVDALGKIGKGGLARAVEAFSSNRKS